MSQYNNSTNTLDRNRNITTTAISYTALQTDDVIEVTSTAAARTITLPAPATTGATTSIGKVFAIKDTSGNAATNNITIATAGGTIDGFATLTINTNYGYFQIVCDGTNYFSIATQNQGNTPTLNAQTFTISGTYTPSSNIQYAIVELLGGGGGGGGSMGLNNCNVGSGGGAGGYAKFSVTSSQVGASKLITIGSAGTGSTTTGSAGGNTSFGAISTANGGSGGLSVTQSAVPTNTTGLGGAGGTSTISSGTSIIALSGQKGGNCYTASSTALGFISLGSGGSTPYGSGGYGGSVVNISPAAAQAIAPQASSGFGAGGAGGGGVEFGGGGTPPAQVGGNGTAGLCIVTEYIFAPPPLVTTASITWNTVSGTSQTMVSSQGYYTTNAAATTLTLPAACAAGTMMAVIGTNTGLWTMAQLAGQSIQYGAQVTTTGTGGSLVASAQGNAVWLMCTVANTTWVVTDSVGNITVN